MSNTIQSLQEQLAEAKTNLRLIQERKSEFVLEVDIPLQLIKEERRLQEQIAELQGRLSWLAEFPCPYLGLFAFREQDAPLFFGRETFTARLVEALPTPSSSGIRPFSKVQSGPDSDLTNNPRGYTRVRYVLSQTRCF